MNEDSGISFLANLGERDYSGKEILRDIAARTVINKDEMNDRIDEYEGFLDYMQNRTNKVGLEAASMQAGILNGPPKYVNENDQFINKRAYEMNAEELANNGFNPDNDAEIRTVLEKINNAQNEKEAFHAFLEYTENREFTRRESERSQRVVNIAEQAIPSVKNSGGIFKRVDPLVAGAFQERNAKMDTDITNAYNKMMEAQQKGKDLPPGQEREEFKAAFNAAKEDYKKAKDKKQKDAREVKFDYQRGAEVNVPLLKEKLKNMVRQVRDYPELKHKIGSLNIMWNTPVGSRKAKTDNETMSVNTYAGGSEKAIINYDAYLDRDSKEARQERDFYNKQREESGSSNLGRSGNHELGHVLESTLNTELNDHKKNQASNDILQSVLPKVMTQDELNEVKYNENNGKNRFDARIYKGQIDTQSEVFKRKKMTSVYGQSKPSEWLAEAFQDVYTRGAAAKPTSIEIVKEYEKRQTAMQKSNFQKKKRGWFTNIVRGISKWFGFGTVHADQRMNPSNDLQSPAMPNIAPMPEIPDPGPAVQGPQLIEDNDVPGAVNNNHYEDNFLDKAMLADIKKKGKKRKKKK